MALLYVLFSKFVPIISIWELKVGEHPKLTRADETPTKRRRSGGRSPMTERDVRALRRARRRPARVHGAEAGRRRRERHHRRSRPSRSRRSSSATATTRSCCSASRLSAASSASSAAVLLTTGTELAWPLNTGGMPIVAWWPNLVIIFEMTMLARFSRRSSRCSSPRGCRPRDVAVRSGSVGRQDSRRRRRSRPIGRPRRSVARSTRAERSP